MTKIEWGKVGDRKFEAGISRGVMYPPNESAVPWNGLTDITENLGDGGLQPLFLEGIRIMDRQLRSDYSAKIKAFTYPDILNELTGLRTFGSGLQVDGQRAKRFGLSYRTGVGSDSDVSVSGSKIHLVYNVLARPSTRGSSTIDSNVAPSEFEWDISTKPVQLVGFQPSAHFVVDTTSADPAAVLAFERLIYGSDISDPQMPGPLDLLSIFADGPTVTAVNSDGSFDISGQPQFFNITGDGTEFEVRNMKTTSSDEDEYTIETDE